MDKHILNLIEENMEEVAPSFIASKRYLLKCAPQLLDSYFSLSTEIDVQVMLRKHLGKTSYSVLKKTIITFGTL